MQNGFKSSHWLNEEGNPAGGSSYGTGFAISWQNGPLGRGTERRDPNGAFVEDIIAAAMDRITFYQRGRFNCDENHRALLHLADAVAALKARTAAREARDVEGTHQP